MSPRRPDLPALHRDQLADDPLDQFAEWFALAVGEVPLAEAMTLATVDEAGTPDARMVLLKGHGPDGFRFFTNLESAKAAQLDAVRRGALVVYWRELDRQVRARGAVERLGDRQSDEYFATRPRQAQVGAWASPQSTPIGSRDQLDALVDEQVIRFEGESVPRPGHWGGYRLIPELVEFWQGQTGRLHDRFRYRRGGGGGWTIERLAP